MVLFNAYLINLFVMVAIALFLLVLLGSAISYIRLQKRILELNLDLNISSTQIEHEKECDIIMHSLATPYFFSKATKFLVLSLVGATVAFYLSQYFNVNSPGNIIMGLFIACLVILLIKATESLVSLGLIGGSIVGFHISQYFSVKNLN